MGGGREEQRAADLAALLAERARVVSALRRICAEVSATTTGTTTSRSGT
jgi:hypothetical protein